MIIGTALIVILGTVGHFAFGEHWTRELDSMALTAVLVALPMAVFRIGGGVARLARWLFGRGGPRPAPEPVARWVEYVRLTLAIAGVAGLLVLIQWDFYRDEIQAEAKAQAALQKSVTALTVIANKHAEFARERELLSEKAKVLRRMMPESLGVVDLVEQLRAVCQEHGFQVWSWQARELTKDRVHRAELTLVLDGDAANLKALGDRIEKEMVRLVSWAVDGVTGPRVAARATIYALPVRPVKAAPDSCSPRDSNVWLWPLRSNLENARQVRWDLCREQERLDPVRRSVDAFEVERQRFTEMVDTIERLRADRPAGRIVPPDALTDPSPEPSPSPKPERRATSKQT